VEPRLSLPADTGCWGWCIMIPDGRSSLSEENDASSDSELAEGLVRVSMIVLRLSTNSTDPSEEVEVRRLFCVALFDG